ncbi:hypothetical protein DYST_01464 [Dyella terrae]|nr:hypothetical protein DYST_01464 [Dyella terrae]
MSWRMRLRRRYRRLRSDAVLMIGLVRGGYWLGMRGALSSAPSPLRGEGWGEGWVLAAPFHLSRHPCVGRDPVASVVGCRLERYCDQAAYAAGVSIVCRRWSLFSLLAHARAGARANGEAGPKGGGQDARSKESNPKKWPSTPTPAACRWDKPERLRRVVAWPPSPLHSGYFRALRNAPSRKGLKAGLATLPDR